MEKTRTKRLLSMLLCVMMVLSLMPSVAFAATSFTQSQLSVVTDKQSQLADGVTQNIYTVYDKNGKQVKMFAATIDPSVETVKLFTSYKDMDNSSYGMSKLTEQVAAFNAKAAEGDEYYSGTVVAGINASYYNMTTGKPSGVFVMNGNDVTGGDRSAYFAVMKDGSVKIGNASEYAADKGNIQEALGIYKMLVYGGEIALSEEDQANTQKYPRQTIGITADGKVILLSADGNNEPTSAGLTLMEQAQVMLDLGCVYAGHLDGGGSMTYGSKPEGEDSFKIVNHPSDGSERSISNGLIVVSTAVASKTFDHVTFDAETEYVTPGTPVAVSVSGVSSTGHATDIPADLTYSVTNGTYENGVLTASAAGDVVLTANYNGSEVGSVTIHAVVPEKIAFVNSNMTVPFGKTVSLDISATYGLNAVKFKASDFTFTLEHNEIGTIDELNFTAGDGSVTTSKLTATFTGTEVSAEATINLGRGSVVLWDFEDGDVSEFRRAAASKYNYIIAPGSCSLVTAETGKVHSGKYAMKFNVDFSVSLESGYMNARLCVKNNSGERIDLKDATRIGMWIYFPLEAKSLNGRVFLQAVTARNEDGSIKSVNNSYNTATLIDDGGNWNCGFVTQYDEPGWHYVYFNLSGGDWCIPADWTMLDMYINDRDGSDYNYYHQNYKSQNSNIVMYLDDITVDYSSAVDDRDAPVFSNVRWADTTMSDAAAFTRGTTAQTTSNTISFSAAVADKEKDNATGLDESTAKIYVDGVEVSGTFKDGVMSVADCVLADGIHTVKFSICDKQGNYASVIRKINVQADSGMSTVKLMPNDAELNNILLGSVYYIDIVATDIEKVQSVSADIDLNNMSRWELDHMVAADGFEASYTVSDSGENIATITVTRTGETDATGEGALVSMPVRTWELPAFSADGGVHNGKVWMYPEYKSGNEVWPIDISASVVRGTVTFTDNTSDIFTGSEVQVDTEAHYWTNITKPADYSSWNGGHDHRAETKEYYSKTATNHVDAIALADKAATCTEDGYTGRTYCEVCSSVVDWGTTVPATGHSYALGEDGVLKCSSCGDLYSGVWTDGKTYSDGVVIADGWVDDSYYKDGVKLTGIQKVPAPDNSGEFYYDFGDNGVCIGKYNGLLSDDFGLFYVRVGTPASGWMTTNVGDVYYMGTLHNGIYYAMVGEVELGSPLVSYLFDENGKLVRGGWHDTADGLRYYWAGAVIKNKLCDVAGKTYFFNRAGYAVSGVCNVATGYYDTPVYYVFDNVTHERVYVENGIVSCNETHYAYADGVLIKGLQQIDGKFYYFSVNSYAMRTGHYIVSYKNSNSLLTKDRAFDFDATNGYAVDASGAPITSLEENPDPKPTNGFVTENGNTYYVNADGTRATGLQQIDGKFYYFSVNSYAMRTGHYIVSYKNSNSLLTKDRAFDFDATNGYAVDASGAPITSLEENPDPKPTNGFVTENGNTYYVNADGTRATGLQQIDGKFYYFSVNSYAMRTGHYIVSYKNSNSLLTKDRAFDFDATNGYAVDASGAPITSLEENPDPKPTNGFVTENGNTYYVNADGTRATGLQQIDGKFYYFSVNSYAMRTGHYIVSYKNSNSLLTKDRAFDFDATNGYAVDASGAPITSLY